MHVSFLVPDIHDRPTGGNIYNRRIITELQRRWTADLRPWSPGAEPLPSISFSDDAVLVIDSLLVEHDDALRALRTAHPEASIFLLAHYLHCIDPREQSSPAATTERSVLPLFDGAVTTSRYARDALASAGMENARIEVVPPGLDAAYRAPLPEPEAYSASRLLTVANLLPGKGLLSFIDGLSALDDLDWTWTLVGDDTLDPDFAATVQDRLRAASLAERVTGLGSVPPDEMRAQYDRADVFVLPSRFETCSMAAREAMARGLPVVGYAVGGLPENFGDAEAGTLVSPDSPDAFVDALRFLLTHPGRRKKMGEAARARSRTFPTWAEAASRFQLVLARG